MKSSVSAESDIMWMYASPILKTSFRNLALSSVATKVQFCVLHVESRCPVDRGMPCRGFVTPIMVHTMHVLSTTC